MQAQQLFAEAPVAYLATVTVAGAPHVVPVVFAVVNDIVYTAVDEKPKSTRHLKRLDNIAAHPRVSLLVDHYEDDWTALWWVRADGIAQVMPIDKCRPAIDALVAKYPQYRQLPPAGPVIAVMDVQWQSWSAF